MNRRGCRWWRCPRSTWKLIQRVSLRVCHVDGSPSKHFRRQPVKPTSHPCLVEWLQALGFLWSHKFAQQPTTYASILPSTIRGIDWVLGSIAFCKCQASELHQHQRFVGTAEVMIHLKQGNHPGPAGQDTSHHYRISTPSRIKSKAYPHRSKGDVQSLPWGCSIPRVTRFNLGTL